jgi:preprotein translocase subunit SecE
MDFYGKDVTGGRQCMTKELARSIPGIGFLREAKAELKKVTWPGRTQIWYSTLIVIAFTLCVSLYLGVVDFFLTWIFSSIL